MAKVGYIYLNIDDDALPADKAWMEQYGCISIFEDKAEDEEDRPQWHNLLKYLSRGDELVVSKFSNCSRGLREFTILIELCRKDMIRLISIRDEIDSKNKIFNPLPPMRVLEMVGSLMEEIIALRRASTHIQLMKEHTTVRQTQIIKRKEKNVREHMIVAMYNEGYSISDIWKMSGFRSQSSVFRILNKYGVVLRKVQEREGDRTLDEGIKRP